MKTGQESDAVASESERSQWDRGNAVGRGGTMHRGHALSYALVVGDNISTANMVT